MFITVVQGRHKLDRTGVVCYGRLDSGGVHLGFFLVRQGGNKNNLIFYKKNSGALRRKVSE